MKLTHGVYVLLGRKRDDLAADTRILRYDNPGVWFKESFGDGMHWSVCEQLMVALYAHSTEKQVSLLWTQNPSILDRLCFESVDDAREHILLSQADAPPRRMTDDEVVRFYRSVTVGIQHVSEILREQRLW